jgi:hypothetical protein
MENDRWFRVAVIGGGIMSVILTATLFFMKWTGIDLLVRHIDGGKRLGWQRREWMFPRQKQGQCQKGKESDCNRSHGCSLSWVRLARNLTEVEDRTDGPGSAKNRSAN